MYGIVWVKHCVSSHSHLSYLHQMSRDTEFPTIIACAPSGDSDQRRSAGASAQAAQSLRSQFEDALDPKT